MKILFPMTKYIRKHGGLWICGMLLPACFSTITNIYFAGRLQAYVTNIAGYPTSFSGIAGSFLVTLPVLLLFSVIDNIGLFLFSLFLASTENELRYDFYNSFVYTSLQNIQRFDQGEFLTRYNTDVERATQIVSYDMFGVFYPLIAGIGYMIAILWADVKIGVLMGIFGLAIILLNFLFVRKMKCVQTEILQVKEMVASCCNDTIKGKMSVRQYGAQKVMSSKIEEAANKLYQKERQAIRLEIWKCLTSDTITNGCLYLLTPFACIMAALGYLDIPVVLFLHQLCRCFIQYTQNFATSFLHFSSHSLSFERVNSILALEKERIEKGIEKNVTNDWKEPKNDSLRFEKVCVAYGSHQVLEDISFAVFPGECIGIVGESGSGKSTLVKALLQMVEYQGEIYIGKENCRNLPLYQLRNYIAYVPEHSDIFPTTVYDNIHYGRLSATEKEILHVKELAGITERIEKGEQLSGGQKQKVSIARALLKNAPIYVFDEPTAALDADSESKILETILKLKRDGKCILLITHKASTLCVADKVLRVS